MQPSFWVYENTPTNHARIHLGSCSHCNEGKGTHGHPGTGPTSKWHGPFGSYLKAEQKAKDTGKPYKVCAFCNPH